MKLFLFITKLFFTATLILLTANALANDIKTVTWPTYQQNDAHTGYVDVAIDIKSLKFDWKTKLEDSDSNTDSYGMYFSQPLVAGNKIFVLLNHYAIPEHNKLYAIDNNAGQLTWSKSISESAFGPFINDNKIYVEFTNQHTQKASLYSFKMDNGEISFNTPIPESIPSLYKDDIYLMGDIAIFSVDKTNANIKWRTPFKHTFYTRLAANDSFVFVYANNPTTKYGSLSIYNRDSGKFLTTVDNDYDYASEPSGMPVMLDANEILFSTGGEHRVGYFYQVYNILNQTFTRLSDLDFSSVQPSTDGQYVYGYTSTNDLVCLDKKGNVIWQWQAETSSDLIVTKNLIFGINKNNSVYAISKETHKQVWSYPISHANSLSLGMGHLYVMGGDELYSFTVN
jgi:outer membrane protein assembly factor BamB